MGTNRERERDRVRARAQIDVHADGSARAKRMAKTAKTMHFDVGLSRFCAYIVGLCLSCDEEKELSDGNTENMKYARHTIPTFALFERYRSFEPSYR